MSVTIDEKTRTHVAILNEEMGQVKNILEDHTEKLESLATEIATLKTDLSWIKRGVLAIIAIVISNIAGLIG